jgi:hypothetical protein
LDDARTKRKRLYQEKRDAYIGLLAAIHAAGANPCEKNAYAYALWQVKCKVYGSLKVAILTDDFASSEPGTPERHRVGDMLIKTMRDELTA